MNLTYASEAMRMFIRRVKVSFSGFKRYEGSPVEIARQIIKDCYDEKNSYFRVSGGNGHFCEFYARDFGWCAEALLSLGYRKQVLSTLSYALDIFKKHGRIEQSISPSGKPFTFPDAEISDALPFIIHTIRLAKADAIVRKHRIFLDREIKRHFNIAIDKKTGLVKNDVHISSMKDYSVRRSSCYDNVMAGMMAQDISMLGLANPFKEYDYSRLIVNNFWTGEYFLDDLSGSKRICGDANTLTFWADIIRDKGMLKKAVSSVRKEGLDKPFPLKYTRTRFSGQRMILQESLAGDYERGAVWSHMGMMFIKVIAGLDQALARKYLAQYEKQILLHRNFLEVYGRNGKPFKTLLYCSDESMLWAVNFLYLKKILD